MSSSRKSWTGAGLAAAAVGAITVGLIPGPAQAQAAAPSIQVIADKLNGPRGITVLRDGTILVAEAGRGGKGPCVGQGERKQCFGLSGSIYRVKGGAKGRVVRNLPSTGESGPVDVAMDGRDYIVLNSAGGSLKDRKAFGPKAKTLGTLMRVRGGKVLGDLVSHETRLDPDWVLGHDPKMEPSVNGNPWRFVQVRGGSLVTDAGGNDLVRVSGGRTSTEAIFPDNMVTAPSSAAPSKAAKSFARSAQGRKLSRMVAGDAPPEKIPTQSVPTGVVRGPDGATYVSELGGFMPGASRIWRIAPGQRPRVFVSGLTSVVDLALDGRGNLIALTMMNGMPPNGPNDPLPPGALFKINLRTKHRSEILTAGKLSAPAGLGIGPGAALYVSNNGMGPVGQLVRVRP